MFVMIRKSIAIILFTFVCISAHAQLQITSNVNASYSFNENLDRITVQENEEQCTLTVYTDQNKILLRCNSTQWEFTITSAHEITMESGSIYHYDILGTDGTKQKLEINTQKNSFIFKPWEIKPGETSRKFYQSQD